MDGTCGCRFRAKNAKKFIRMHIHSVSVSILAATGCLDGEGESGVYTIGALGPHTVSCIMYMHVVCITACTQAILYYTHTANNCFKAQRNMWQN
jgi:hypothetical protein